MAAPLAVSAYLGTLIVIDWKTRKVPNWLTLPGMAGLALWRLARLEPAFLAWWAAIYLCWLVNIWGGGDAKVLMVMSALWPNISFLMVEALTVLSLGVPLLVVKYRGRSPVELAQEVQARIVARNVLPTREMLAAQGPGTFLVATGGIVYAWLVWAGKTG